MENNLEDLIELILANSSIVSKDSLEKGKWITREKVILNIIEMSDAHLLYSINFWRNWMNPISLRDPISLRGFNINNIHNKRANSFQKIMVGLSPKDKVVLEKFCNRLGHNRSLIHNKNYQHLITEAERRKLMHRSKT